MSAPLWPGFRISFLLLLFALAGTAHAKQCDAVLEALQNILTPRSPHLQAAVARAQEKIMQLPFLVRRRILKELRNVHYAVERDAWGTVRATHSLAEYLMSMVGEEDKIGATYEFLIGFQEFADGLYINGSMRGHPLAEIVLAHELSHMSRVYNRLGFQSSHHFLTKLDKNGLLDEEALAIGDEYDEFHADYKPSDLGAVRARYPYTDRVVGKKGPGLGFSLSPGEKEQELMNYVFVTKLDKAFSLSREQYIQERLKSYQSAQASDDAFATEAKGSAVVRAMLGLHHLVFGQ